MRKTMKPKNCTICGEEYTPKGTTSKFCGVTCKNKHFAIKRAEREGRVYKQRQQEKIPDKYLVRGRISGVDARLIEYVRHKEGITYLEMGRIINVDSSILSSHKFGANKALQILVRARLARPFWVKRFDDYYEDTQNNDYSIQKLRKIQKEFFPVVSGGGLGGRRVEVPEGVEL